ncbi:MAG: peptidase S10 [Planctomycetes bacterium]|nr:peptidase S10 [Planctomycetota bacterium]
MLHTALLLALLPCLPTQEPAPPAAADAAEPQDQAVERSFQATLGGETFGYTSTAGEYVLRTEEGAAKATIFYVAYTRDGVEDPATRPLTFCFNGGPGSSSVWLHLGAFGPKRVDMGDAGALLPPPWKLVPNEASLLDVTDLVFVDPVMTGYSRPAEGEAREQFHGLSEDIAWVAEFIRLYTTREERWSSPKLLAGESYGTTRAAGLAQELQDHHGMYLNGIVLVSSILNFQTARFEPGNDLPYELFLPTYTATAYYHGRLDAELSRDLVATLDEVERFALGDYAHALALGDRLSDTERAEVAARVARYTGVDAEWVLACNLRLRIDRFTKQLRRDERVTVGRLDSRFTGRDADAAGESYEYDPSYAAIQGPYTATLNDYVRRELGFESDLPYEILTGRVHPWSFAEFENAYVDVAPRLREAMTKNPALLVYVANGYHDLATPYFATRYTFDHLGLEPALRGHVRMGYFESGHMMYVHEPSRAALREQLAAFVREAAGAR